MRWDELVVGRNYVLRPIQMHNKSIQDALTGLTVTLLEKPKTRPERASIYAYRIRINEIAPGIGDDLPNVIVVPGFWLLECSDDKPGGNCKCSNFTLNLNGCMCGSIERYKVPR